MFHAQELGSYAQGQVSLAVFKVTARDQGHYKGHSGAFVTYCYISCFFLVFSRIWDLFVNFPFLRSSIPSALAYEVYVPRLVRYANMRYVICQTG